MFLSTEDLNFIEVEAENAVGSLRLSSNVDPQSLHVEVKRYESDLSTFEPNKKRY
jgi:hypothetical protein